MPIQARVSAQPRQLADGYCDDAKTQSVSTRSRIDRLHQHPRFVLQPDVGLAEIHRGVAQQVPPVSHEIRQASFLDPPQRSLIRIHFENFAGPQRPDGNLNTRGVQSPIVERSRGVNFTNFDPSVIQIDDTQIGGCPYQHCLVQTPAEDKFFTADNTDRTDFTVNQMHFQDFSQRDIRQFPANAVVV